jgi:acyl carrier protein
MCAWWGDDVGDACTDVDSELGVFADARAVVSARVGEDYVFSFAGFAILRLPPEAVRVDQPLPGLGLDSLGGIELRMALERRLGVSVPLTAVTEDLTLAILVQRVADVLFKDDAVIATAEALMETHEPAAVP